MIKIALIGAGQRGNIYAEQIHISEGVEIVAVVEPNEERRIIAMEAYDLKNDQAYTSSQDFFDKGKIADAIILANMDRDHYIDAMAAMDLGYDLLLEKPISPVMSEVMDIREKADATGCNVIVCHVLRYTKFFSEIKQIIDSGELGRVITIAHNENIGNFHMAHSFVRGNWSQAAVSSPLIMQKSCHDMDILTWLVGSESKTISSFGDLTFFKEANAPAGSSERCLQCSVSDACRFDVKKTYLPIRGTWPATVISDDQTEEGLLEALETSPYGRCVYRCNNDVCDNQVTLIEYKNGVTVSFNLSAFTDRMGRTIKIMCEHGEIRGDDVRNVIEVSKFTSTQSEGYSQRVIHPAIVEGGHGGGDTELMEDFIRELKMKSPSVDNRSSIQKSVESHIMSYAAETSRVTGVTVDVDDIKASIISKG